MIETFERLVFLERRGMKNIHRPGATLDLESTRIRMADVIKKIGAERDVADILQTERIIADPDEYRIVAKSYYDPKNLKRGVPYDEARQFFTSQIGRLVNMNKTRLDAPTRAIVEVRKSNMDKADDAYEMMQRKVLGLD